MQSKTAQLWLSHASADSSLHGASLCNPKWTPAFSKSRRLISENLYIELFRPGQCRQIETPWLQVALGIHFTKIYHASSNQWLIAGCQTLTCTTLAEVALRSPTFQSLPQYVFHCARVNKALTILIFLSQHTINWRVFPHPCTDNALCENLPLHYDQYEPPD